MLRRVASVLKMLPDLPVLDILPAADKIMELHGGGGAAWTLRCTAMLGVAVFKSLVW